MHKNFRQDRGPPNPIFSEYSGIFPWAQSSRGMNLFLVPRLRIREALSPFLHLPSCSGIKLGTGTLPVNLLLFLATPQTRADATRDSLHIVARRQFFWPAITHTSSAVILNGGNTPIFLSFASSSSFLAITGRSLVAMCFCPGDLDAVYKLVDLPPEWILHSDSERLRMWLTSVLFPKAHTTDNEFGSDDQH